MKPRLSSLLAPLLVFSGGPATAASEAELRERIAALEAELAAARAELAAHGKPANGPADPPFEQAVDPAAIAEPPADAPEDGLRFGDFTLGGAMRVNWTLGDYSGGGDGPLRGGHGGDFSLDTFRLNLDYARGDLFGKAEYRWYTGTNFVHTLEFGYRRDVRLTLRGGLTRVPFGVGPYGPSNNWFFDQHYYVGLADDMDLGVVGTFKRDAWTLDLGLFAGAEPNMRGSSDAGARYSFDIVDASGDSNHFGNRTPTAYEESAQLNIRAVRGFADAAVPTDLGISLQLGRLNGLHGTADAHPFAVSLHSLSTLGPWELKLQATRYDYDSDRRHITGGFYDYTTDIAARGDILSAALSYTWETRCRGWIRSPSTTTSA